MIYANGCSFVMGQELVDNHSLNMENKRSAFPAKLGAYNDAWSGSSNHAIMNRTLDYCKNNKVEIAIIGWTAYSRVLTLGDNPRNDRLGQFTAKPTTKDAPMHEKYYHNDEMLKQWSRNVIECTYYWLKSNNIIPIFFNSMDKFKTDVPMLWDGLSWRNVYHDQFNLEVNFERHPDQKMHDWMADYLKNEITKSKTSY